MQAAEADAEEAEPPAADDMLDDDLLAVLQVDEPMVTDFGPAANEVTPSTAPRFPSASASASSSGACRFPDTPAPSRTQGPKKGVNVKNGRRGARVSPPADNDEREQTDAINRMVTVVEAAMQRQPVNQATPAAMTQNDLWCEVIRHQLARMTEDVSIMLNMSIVWGWGGVCILKKL